jgi:tetratricopeptide (TPR) repeat protein
MSATARATLEAQADQVRRDLAELGDQVESGEIDDDTARHLRRTYRTELAELEEAIGRQATAPDRAGEGRSSRRMLVGAALLVGSLALTVGVVGSFAQQRDDGPLEGVAAAAGVDLDEVSNETMEAVIASSRDDPDPAVAAQIPRMELALAERYFEEQAYERAFDHYGAIIENPAAGPDVIAPALGRVGWIVWLLNGETDLALSTVDRSLELDPDDPETLYVKGRITWCGSGDADAAAALFERVLAIPDLPDDVVTQVSQDLEQAASGASCQ